MTTKINHRQELEQIKKSIYIMNEDTTLSFLDVSGLNKYEAPCVAVSGNVEVASNINEILVYHQDDQGNVYEANQQSLSNVSYDTYDFFRFTFDDFEEDEPPVPDEIYVKVTFVDGQVFVFKKTVSEFAEINKLMREAFDELEKKQRK